MCVCSWDDKVVATIVDNQRSAIGDQRSWIEWANLFATRLTCLSIKIKFDAILEQTLGHSCTALLCTLVPIINHLGASAITFNQPINLVQFIKKAKTRRRPKSCSSKLPLITAIDRYFLWLLIRRPSTETATGTKSWDLRLRLRLRLSTETASEPANACLGSARSRCCGKV